MYPESFIWWVGGTAVIMGILGLIGLLALYVDHRISLWQKKKGKEMGTFKEDDDDRR